MPAITAKIITILIIAVISIHITVEEVIIPSPIEAKTLRTKNLKRRKTAKARQTMQAGYVKEEIIFLLSI